jgi:hypothetical protein
MATAVGGKLPKLQRTSALKVAVGTVLSYGPGGAGKTFSIKKMKEHGMNPVVLTTELGLTHGLLTLQSEDIPYIPITTHNEAMEVIAAMKRKPGKIEYEQTEFGSVVLDSITQWGEFPLDRFIELKGWDDLSTPESKKDPRGAYAFLAEKGRQLYKALFELHGHLYIIAREGLFGGGDEALFAAPELPGQKLPRELPGWPDATVRLRRIAGEHRMVTMGEGGSPARVRLPSDYPQLPLRCNPDIGALIKFMCGDRSMIDLLRTEKATPPPLVKATAAATASAASAASAKA